MPNMSSKDSEIHDAQDLIHALQNRAPASPLVTLQTTHNDSLITPSRIFVKASSPEELPRVVHPEQHQPIIENIPDKIQTYNHTESLRVSIVETHP